MPQPVSMSAACLEPTNGATLRHAVVIAFRADTSPVAHAG